MRRVALASIVAGLQAVAATALANPWADCGTMAYAEVPYQYCLGLAEAERAIAEAKWSDAIAMLEKLRTAEIDESTPNYRPLLLLGIAHCGKGDRAAGIGFLSLYACALRVDYGAMSCWIDGEPGKGVRPDLPPACAAIVCGEGYLRSDPAELPPLIREFEAARYRCN